MTQEIIVYIILAITLASIIYSFRKKKGAKQVTTSGGTCGDGGCSGCELKKHCH